MKFPRVNKIFPTLTTKGLVSVQPMSAPTSGSVFHLDFQLNPFECEFIPLRGTSADQNIYDDIHNNIDKILTELS